MSFSRIKEMRRRGDPLKAQGVTIVPLPNPSADGQTEEEGSTHFHFSALVELLKKMKSAAAAVSEPKPYLLLMHDE